MKIRLRTRKTHRVVGLIMLLPLFGWAITGFVFFVKPGYEGAYELLQVKSYPMNGEAMTLTPASSWLEFRGFKTILGNHLIVRTAQGWQHLDPATLAVKAQPTDDEIKKLLQDAFSANPERYGQVAKIEGGTITTTTNVRVALNWNRLSLQQTGSDTDRIDWLYKIHYLQWTGVKWLDKILGMLGLTLIVVLSVLGLALQRRPSPKKQIREESVLDEK
ncbi:MAG: PepSY domain-containing protein [Acidobacteriota bacterium]